MSPSIELEIIANLTDLASVKAKRSSRRGQLTRLKTRYESFVNEHSFLDISQEDIAELSVTCKENVTLHKALQQRYEELRESNSTASSSEREDEIMRDLKILDDHSDLLRAVSKNYKAKQIYNQGTCLLDSLNTINEVDCISTPAIITKVQTLEEKITSLKEQA